MLDHLHSAFSAGGTARLPANLRSASSTLGSVRRERDSGQGILILRLAHGLIVASWNFIGNAQITFTRRFSTSGCGLRHPSQLLGGSIVTSEGLDGPRGGLA